MCDTGSDLITDYTINTHYSQLSELSQTAGMTTIIDSCVMKPMVLSIESL